ncbi:hypothetical protein TIFTF001_040331 [Ficus carica]|uniref:Uncharacterized protein n=1 Tax=Ficus carica TaxID=3494 RepID=A0AA87YSZ4_FICCA|nr:hypothetical protein TIFTF001_040323 [Ficus carica]GMN22728.1 hypothetical protein TIFTF001_040325 [Ficus carica]GMN22742.1 hypothetical protein TIFTF001_040329 [Ficus carica]GMN22754.1 hypothetical protein TIFTF001_040331 [Ficus carica]
MARLVPTFCNRRSGDGSAMVTVRPRDGEKLVTARQRDGAAKVVRVERERSRESGLEESTVKLFLKWRVLGVKRVCIY